MLRLSHHRWDSDSDDDDDDGHKQLEEHEDRLSQCPTTEYLPSVAQSVHNKELNVNELAPASGSSVLDEPFRTEATIDENEALSTNAEADNSSLAKPRSTARASRRVRGRSGKKHRRETGVSARAFALVEAAQLGQWPAAAFSRLCNALSDARAPAPLAIRLALRRAWCRPALQLLVSHSGLRGGGITFEQHELFQNEPDFAAKLLSDIACSPPAAEPAAAAACGQEADEAQQAATLTAWPWTVVVTI